MDDVRAAGNRWVALAILTFARVGMGFQFQSVGAVAPLLLARLRVQHTELGALIGLFSLPGIVLALPGGLLGARFGDRRVVLIGLALMVAGSAVIAVTDAFAIAATGRLLSATGSILLNVLLTKMVADWFSGREIIWAMALLINAWPIGIGAALFVLPTVAARSGVGAAFLFASAVAILGLLAVGLFYRNPEVGGQGGAGGPLWALSRGDLAALSLAALPWMLYNVGYAVTLGFVPAFLVGRGFSVAQAGLLVGLSTVLVVVSVQVGGGIAQWLARTNVVVVVGLLTFCVALLVLPHAPVLPTLILMGLLGGLPAGALVAAPTTVLQPESRGSGMGFFYTLYYLGMTVLPPVAGWLQDVTDRPEAPLDFAGACFLVSLPCWLVFRSVAQRGLR